MRTINIKTPPATPAGVLFLRKEWNGNRSNCCHLCKWRIKKTGKSPPVGKSADLLVAADGGLRHALVLGFPPHLLIGDLDSVSKSDVARVEEAGVKFSNFPRKKTKLIWS